MKRILAIIALGAAVAASFTGCNNKPPYERLATAVDSINTVMQQNPIDFADSASVSFDEITNTVKYTFVLPGKVDTAQMAAAGTQFEQAFLMASVLNDPDFGEKVVEAKSNIAVLFEGNEGGKFEFMIENATIDKTFRAIFPAKEQE